MTICSAKDTNSLTFFFHKDLNTSFMVFEKPRRPFLLLSNCFSVFSSILFIVLSDMTSPSSISMILSAKEDSTSRLCEETITRQSFDMSLSISPICFEFSSSKAAVGSSKINTEGFFRSALAMDTLCF